MLKDSTDVYVRDAGIEVRTGHKWNVEEVVEAAESQLRHKNIIGTTTQGRLGLGCITRAMWREASVEERRHLVQEEIRQKKSREWREQLGWPSREPGHDGMMHCKGS